MRYLSTRGQAPVSAAQAILNGLSPDGGLYVPESIPAAPAEWLDPAQACTYQELAAQVLSLYFPELGEDALKTMCQEAYASFAAPEVTPVTRLDDDTWLLELYHGPTLAFKDVALQLLRRLIVRAARLTGEKRTIHILTATSGDTGKAALEGFRDVEGTACTVFYPKDGVTELQYRQMATSQGKNVQVVAVRGNFDDAQTGVKRLFSDPGFRAELDREGRLPSSANSINIGRLIPQIVYYFFGYRALRQAGQLQTGETMDVCVPTGNFGDILAAWYAKRMGAPIQKLICASNQNDVLTDFIRTGVYDRKRAFRKTISPSMDILISSNLERFLLELAEGDTAQVRAWMDSLRQEGVYELNDGQKAKLKDIFFGGFADDEKTRATIADMWRDEHYLLDPHTAVAASVAKEYRQETGDMRPMLIVSTASPYKFAADVAASIGVTVQGDAFDAAQALENATQVKAPKAITELKTMPILHTRVCEKDQMGEAVLAGFKDA